jgi:hypothetical protein
MLALHELGRELEFGVRQLQTEVAGRSADGVTIPRSSELAQHHDVIGIVPLEIRSQLTLAPEPQMIVHHLARLPRHRSLLGSMTP